jgi:hypothetical protein
MGTAVRVVAGLEVRQGLIPGMGRDFYLHDYLWGPNGFFFPVVIVCFLIKKVAG